ncbi:hypothetical protein TNCV_1127031 [Trichonephila clavipes]|nr:hypothetical protein TNCV_1127031 [Trichonephila clavipes]
MSLSPGATKDLPCKGADGSLESRVPQLERRPHHKLRTRNKAGHMQFSLQSNKIYPAISTPVGVVWKFGKEGASSGVILVANGPPYGRCLIAPR